MTEQNTSAEPTVDLDEEVLDDFPGEPEEDTDDDAEGDTFPRHYVEKLRDENAKYRQRAGRADELSRRLHKALVAATGRLADPDDLAFDEAHLDDDQTLHDAIEELLAVKPHLASRRVRGDVGQGAGNPATDSVNLAGLLRSRA